MSSANGKRRQYGRWFAALLGLWLLPALALATTTINHQFSPATIDPGDISRYRITIAQTDVIDLTEAKVTSLLAPDITIAATPNITDTCGFTVQSATPGGSTVWLTGGTVPAGDGAGSDGQCVFEIDVTSTVPGNHVITIPGYENGVSSPDYHSPDETHAGYEAQQSGQPVTNVTEANATLFVATLQDPTGQKVFTPAPAVAGDTIALQITLNNPNSGSTLPLTSFTDDLPSGMQVADPSGAAVNCSGSGASNGSVGAVPGATSVTLTGGTIGEGGTCVISVGVVVPTITGTGQTFDNDVPPGAIGNSRGLDSPAFSGSVTVNSPVGVSKSFDPTAIPAGESSLMTIVIDNASTDNALTITDFTDQLPGSVLVQDSADGVSDPSVSCTGSGASDGTLSDETDAALDSGDTGVKLANAVAGPGGNCTIEVYVTSSTGGSHTNTIDPDDVHNSAGHHSPAASASFTVNDQLTVGKTVSLGQVAPGQWTEFTVTLYNWTGVKVDSVVFTDTLPAPGGQQMVLDNSGGAIPVSSTGCDGGAFSGSDGASVLQWSGGSIAAGSGATPGSCTIRFRVRLPDTATASTTFSNQIPASGVSGVRSDNSAGVINPDASPAASVTTLDKVSVAKSFSPDPIAQGQTSTLTVTVRNRVVSQLTGVNLTDTLPTGLSLASNPSPTNSCNGSLQAFPGDDQVVLTGGSLSPRPDGEVQSTCSFSVKVTGSGVGSYTNTIDPADFDSSEGDFSGTVSDTLSITGGLTATKAFSPSATTRNGGSRATVHIVNQSTGTLTNVSIDDDGLSGLTIANPANATTSCGGSPTLVANPGSTGAQMLGAVLPAGAGCDFSFDVAADGSGPWSNTVPAGNITSAEGAYNSSAASATLSLASAEIGINKSFNPVIVTGGVPSLLTIDVVNSSGIYVHDASFIDTFPDGIVVYSVPDASTNCAGGTVSAVAGDAKVALTGATLAPYDTCQVYVTTTSVKFLNLTNFIPEMAISSTEGLTNAQGTQASLSTLQGLGVMKGFEPAYMAVDEVSRLKIRLVSTFDPNAVNPVTLSGVSFSDPLPDGVVFAADPDATTTCEGASVTADTANQVLTLIGGNLQPGTSCVLEANVTASALGSYTNLISEHGVSTDQGVSNEDSASADLHVVDSPVVSKSFSPATVKIGEKSTLTVTLNNLSGVDLTGVSVVDTLPPGLAVFSVPAATTTCSGGVVSANAGGGEIGLGGASVTVGGSCTFQADVVASVAGELPNTIGAGAIRSDQGLTNPDPATKDLAVLAPPTVGKSFNPTRINADGSDESTLTVTLYNTNSTPIHLTSALVDALPGNLLVSPSPDTGSSCGTVTANAGDSSISLASGSTIPVGSCTFSVDVVTSVTGGYTNTIAAGQLQTDAGPNPEPAVATLGAGQNAAPTVGKSFSPDSIQEGEVSRLTITLGNPNVSSIQLTEAFTDTLPTNVVVDDNPDIGGTCTGAAVTADPGTGTVYCGQGLSIPAGGCTLQVNVTSASAGSYTNSIPAGSLSTDAGTNPQPASDGLVVTASTPPGVTKSLDPSTINPGGISRLVLSLDNANAGNATLVADMTDTLPAQVSVAGTPNVGGTCVGGAHGTVTTSGGSVTYDSGSVIPPGGCTIEVDVTSATPGGPYTNTVAAGALRTDLGDNGAPASADLSVNPTQPPSVSKSFSPALIERNAVSTLSIALGNGNASDATLSADLVDDLPAGVFLAADPNIRVAGGCEAGKVGAPAGGSSVTYQSGALVPAGGCSIAVDVTSAVFGTHTNEIQAGELQTDIGSNAVGTQSDLEVTSIALPVVKSWTNVDDRNGDGAVNPGETVRYSVTVTSQGGVAATGVIFTDPVPAGLAVKSGSVTTTQGTVTAESPVVTVELGTLAGGASATVTFDAIVDQALADGTDVLNQANVTDDQGEDVDSNPVQFTVGKANLVDPPSGTKTYTADGLPVLEWKMVWLNLGSTVAMAAKIVDPLAPGTSFVAGSLSCDNRGAAAGGTVTRCEYDAVNHEVVFEGDIAPEPDPNVTGEDDAVNELVIVFQMDVGAAASVENQGFANWDENNDGSVADDIAGGQAPVGTNDPATRDPGDPTAWSITGVPALSGPGLALLIASLLGTALVRLRRGG